MKERWRGVERRQGVVQQLESSQRVSSKRSWTVSGSEMWQRCCGANERRWGIERRQDVERRWCVERRQEVERWRGVERRWDVERRREVERRRVERQGGVVR